MLRRLAIHPRPAGSRAVQHDDGIIDGPESRFSGSVGRSRRFTTQTIADGGTPAVLRHTVRSRSNLGGLRGEWT